ncbi:MFS transporter [Candidatus Peregrinibacteria bacterium]|nr:MFS transporter [Candidatus Peregrinibacteria bacterium]
MKTPLSTLHLASFNGVIRSLNMMMTFFFAIYFIQIGFSGAQIGLLFAINSITSLITILPSGFSNDKFHSKNLISLSLIMMAIMYTGLAATQNLILIAIVFLLGGIGRNIYSTSIESLFYKTTNHETISKEIGTMHSTNYFIMGLSIIIGGYFLQQNISYETIFLAIGIIFLFLLLIGQIILPINQITEFEIVHYKKDLFKKEIFFFMLIVFLFSLHIGAELTSYGPFLKNYLKLNSLETGLYIGTAILFMVPVSKLIGQKLSRFQAKNILKFGLLFSGLFHILMVNENVALSFAFRALHEIGDSAVFFFLWFFTTKLFTADRIGGNNSIGIFINALGATISSIIFGQIAANYGYHIPLIISGSTTLLAFLLVISFTHLIDRK